MKTVEKALAKFNGMLPNMAAGTSNPLLRCQSMMTPYALLKKDSRMDCKMTDKRPEKNPNKVGSAPSKMIAMVATDSK